MRYCRTGERRWLRSSPWPCRRPETVSDLVAWIQSVPKSRFLAYHMFLSTRDTARLGLVMVRRGEWAGTSVVPATWVSRSTTVSVPSVGYGYLWWIPDRKSPEWAGAFLASGNFGQYILGLPALDMVVVHKRAVTDEFALARNNFADAGPPPSSVSRERFLELADLIVAARCAGSC